MKNDLNVYRMTNDQEPKEEELKRLMHEVALEAGKKSKIAKTELYKRTHQELLSALDREGYGNK